MPNRIIRDSALTSTTLYRLSDGAERLFWRLVLIADDYGRFEADPQLIKSKCFPLWPDGKLKISQVAKWIDELVEVEGIRLYEITGRRYGYFVAWDKHQRVRNKHPRYPDPAEGIPKLPTTFYQRAIPVELMRRLMARDQFCLACGSDLELVIDHIVPVIKGGLAVEDNLQVLCHECNAAKYTRILNFLSPGPDEREFAANRRKLRQDAADRCLNPIQTRIQSESESKVTATDKLVPVTRPEKKPESGVRQVIDTYHDKFLARYGVKPQIDGGKDGKNVKELIGTYGVPKVLDLLDAFFNSTDTFIEQSGRSLGVFKSVVNKLIAQSKPALFSPKTAGNAEVIRAFVKGIEDDRGR